jgi:hypothetical protein
VTADFFCYIFDNENEDGSKIETIYRKPKIYLKMSEVLMNADPKEPILEFLVKS